MIPILLAWTLALPVREAPTWSELYSVEPFDGPALRFVLSPDGRRLATTGEDERLLLWDAETRALVRTIEHGARFGAHLAFSADSKLLVAKLAHQLPGTAGILRAWWTEDGRELSGWKTVALGPADGPALHLHEDGPTIFDPCDERSLIVSSTRTLPSASRGPSFVGQRWRVAPDGLSVATFQVSGLVGGSIPAGTHEDALELRTFAVASGAELGHFHWKGQQAERFPYAGDLATFDFHEVALPVSGEIVVFSFETGRELRRFGEGVCALAEDGERRIAGHFGGSVSVWTGAQRLSRIQALTRPVGRMQINGERLLASGGREYALLDGEKRLFGPLEAAEGRLFGRIALLRDSGALVAREDGRELCRIPLNESIYDEDDFRNVPCELRGERIYYVAAGQLRVAELRTGRELAHLGGHKAAVRRVEFGPTGLLAFTWHQAIELDARGAPVGTPHDNAEAGWLEGRAHFFATTDPSVRPCNALAARARVCAQRQGERIHVELEDGRVLELHAGSGGEPIALSDDGRTLAAAWTDERRERVHVRAWSLPEGREQLRAEHAGSNAELLDFSPDGTQLCVRSGFGDFVYRQGGELAFQTASGPAQMGEDACTRSCDWTRDSRRFVSVSYAGPVRVLDARDGTPELSFDAPDETYGHFARLWIAPDGASFAALYSESDLAYWWSSTLGRRAETRLLTSGSNDPLAFLPDGALVLASRTGVEIWDPATRRRQLELAALPGASVYASKGGQRIAVVAGSRVRVFGRGP